MIVTAARLIAAVVSRVVLQERISRRVPLAMVWVAPGLPRSLVAAGMARGIGPAILPRLWAFYLACARTLVRRFPRASSFSALSTSGMLTALLVVPLPSPPRLSSAGLGYLAIMRIQLLPLGLAPTFFGSRYLPAPEVGLSPESVFGVIWVWFFLGEVPDDDPVAGAPPR